MELNFYLSIVVVLSFSIIHFVEVTSFLARLAGVLGNNKALAYATQNAVFMLTRFFSMMLLPVLGFLVDLRVSKAWYLAMCSSALVGAFILSVIALAMRGKSIAGFYKIIESVKSGKNLLRQILRFPKLMLCADKLHVDLPTLRECFSDRVFWYSSIIFSIYSVSLFCAFFFSLVVPDYRASISQLSGIVNAFATVLLTFYLEPKISVSIDQGRASDALLIKLLIGRVVGVGLISQVFILVLASVFL